MKTNYFRLPSDVKKVTQRAIGICCVFLLGAFTSHAQDISPDEIKRFSIEELMDMEVSMVSRAPQKLSEAASAIQVITHEDIVRSGATSIPEALRLATNLQVAQLNSHTWIISARGFNTIFSNKLLVMIDGRTIYTPLYGGVVWSQHNLLLEDVERIEVVSGPGGTLWGANAVNGVINIITRSSRQSQGLYASVAAGTFLENMASIRYGGTVGSKVSYKVYGQHFNRDATTQTSGIKSRDDWRMLQTGFRIDWSASDKNAFLVQGDYYSGKVNTAKPIRLNGENILGRYTRVFSEKSDLSLQLYYDRYYYEDAPTNSSDDMRTVDLDLQYRFAVGSVHSIVAGGGYRSVKDDADFRDIAVILPRHRDLDLVNIFVQDEMFFADSSLRFTVGTKLLHNVYTNWEWQPNIRLAYVKRKNTVWAAVSRAVRTPSRYDRDYYLPGTPQPPNVPSVAGGPDFVSEKLIAYEAGFRFQPNKVSSFSIAAFYNDYSDVYSVEPDAGTLTYKIRNNSDAESWGIELSGYYQVSRQLRLKGGYSWFGKDISHPRPQVFNPEYLGNDVKHRVLLQSMLSIGKHIEFDITSRYNSKLQKTLATASVPDYFTFDARLAYQYRSIEIAVVGQNLARKYHREFGSLNIPRSIYGKISLRI